MFLLLWKWSRFKVNFMTIWLTWRKFHNPVQHSKTKHIAIGYPFINDHVEDGNIKVHFVNTTYKLADIFKKPLNQKSVMRILNGLGMMEAWYFPNSTKFFLNMRCEIFGLTFANWTNFHYLSNLHSDVTIHLKCSTCFTLEFVSNSFSRSSSLANGKSLSMGNAYFWWALVCEKSH